MKNIDASLEYKNYVIQPQVSSQKMWDIKKKAIIMSNVQCVARNSPVRI